ncbi:TPA: ankyrin repeat domain-containing protein [Stenotrophomonas maltophilia]
MNFEDENYVRVIKAAGALSKSSGGSVELKEFLDSIENIPDLNVLNDKGNSLMHMAAFNGQELVMRELADAGADINVRNEPDGWPPLHCAMYSNSFGCINALVSMGRMSTPRTQKATTRCISQPLTAFQKLLK